MMLAWRSSDDESKLGDHHAALAKAFCAAKSRETVTGREGPAGGNGIVADYNVLPLLRRRQGAGKLYVERHLSDAGSDRQQNHHRSLPLWKLSATPASPTPAAPSRRFMISKAGNCTVHLFASNSTNSRATLALAGVSTKKADYLRDGQSAQGPPAAQYADVDELQNSAEDVKGRHVCARRGSSAPATGHHCRRRHQ